MSDVDSGNPSGQRTKQTEHGLSSAADTVTTYTYDGNGAGQPHTLTKASTSGPSGTSTSTYSYDATGDTTQRSAGQGRQSLTWDEAGRLTAVTGGTNGDSSYIYDADGNLLLQKDPGTTTSYLPGEQLALNTRTGPAPPPTRSPSATPAASTPAETATKAAMPMATRPAATATATPTRNRVTASTPNAVMAPTRTTMIPTADPTAGRTMTSSEQATTLHRRRRIKDILRPGTSSMGESSPSWRADSSAISVSN